MINYIPTKDSPVEEIIEYLRAVAKANDDLATLANRSFDIAFRKALKNSKI